MNSFPADTPVQVMPAGAGEADAQTGKADLKPMADVKPGDKVLSFAEWKSRGTDAKADARLSYEQVKDIATSLHEQRLVHVTLESGETVTATEGHPFLTREGWRDAVLLKKGGQLLLKGDAADASSRWATVAEVRQESRAVRVFNLEVANAHTFFVGKDGVGVHNGFGAYFINFSDGTWYAGKGDESRMNDSVRERTKGKNRKKKSCLHWPANNDKSSFILEDMLIEQAGGIDDPNSLNRRESPGRKLRGR